MTEGQRLATIRELRIIAQRLDLSGNQGIGALVYYAAELLELRKPLSLTDARDAIRAGESARP